MSHPYKFSDMDPEYRERELRAERDEDLALERMLRADVPPPTALPLPAPAARPPRLSPRVENSIVSRVRWLVVLAMLAALCLL